jgi:hypothetical protein
VSAACHFPCHSLSKTLWPNPENLPAEVVYQKQHHSMPHVVPVRPQSRYPRAPRETGSTLFKPQLHPPIDRYTSVHIRKLVDESDEIFPWTMARNARWDGETGGFCMKKIERGRKKLCNAGKRELEQCFCSKTFISVPQGYRVCVNCRYQTIRRHAVR